MILSSMSQNREDELKFLMLPLISRYIRVADDEEMLPPCSINQVGAGLKEISGGEVDQFEVDENVCFGFLLNTRSGIEIPWYSKRITCHTVCPPSLYSSFRSIKSKTKENISPPTTCTTSSPPPLDDGIDITRYSD
jgi:hypothetical protein